MTLSSIDSSQGTAGETVETSSAPSAAEHPAGGTCTVVVLADVVPTGHIGDARALRFPVEGGSLDERCGAFVEFAADEIARRRKVVALHPEWRREPAERAVRFARARGLTDDIASIGLPLSPLALSFVADQLAYLARFLPPGAVAAMATELPHHLLAGGCLRHVTGLGTLPATFAHHASSLLPGSAFIGICAPVQDVMAIQHGELSETLPDLPGSPLQVLSSEPDAKGVPAFTDELLPVLRAHSSHEAPEQPLARIYWGTRRVTEFVAFSAHPQALAYAARSVNAVPCNWCREPVATPQCPFCRSTAHKAPGRRPPLGGPPSRPRPRSAPSVRQIPVALPEDHIPALRSPAFSADATPAPRTPLTVPDPAPASAPALADQPDDLPGPPPERPFLPPDTPPPPRRHPIPRQAPPVDRPVPGPFATAWQEPPLGLPVAPNGHRTAHPLASPEETDG